MFPTWEQLIPKLGTKRLLPRIVNGFSWTLVKWSLEKQQKACRYRQKIVYLQLKSAKELADRWKYVVSD
jgi:hypothetical protein